jgi:hypothetical protein
MTTYNYTKLYGAKVLETNETFCLGSFTPNSNDKLAYISPKFFIHGTLAGTEKFVVKVWGNANCSGTPIFTSSTMTISGITTANWLGFIYSTFQNNNLFSGNEYWVTVTMSGYTRNAYTMYISLIYDYPYPIVASSNTQFMLNPIAFRIYVQQVLA